MSERAKDMLARLALFGAAIVWGSSFFIIKGAVDRLPPPTLMAVRFTIGALVLAVIFHKRVKTLTGRDWLRCAPVGILLASAALVQNIGIVDTTPGKNAFLTTIYCVIVPFLFWGIKKKRPEGKRFVAAFLCLAGIGLVSLNDSLSIGRGDVMSLISGLLYALHIIAIATLGEDVDPVGLTVIQFTYSAGLIWAYALAFDGSPLNQDWSVWPQVLYLALFSTAGGYLMQIIGQKRASASASSLILSLESVFGVLFSVLFYGETLTPRLALGFAVIFLSIVISEIDLPALRAHGRLRHVS